MVIYFISGLIQNSIALDFQQFPFILKVMDDDIGKKFYTIADKSNYLFKCVPM